MVRQRTDPPGRTVHSGRFSLPDWMTPMMKPLTPHPAHNDQPAEHAPAAPIAPVAPGTLVALACTAALVLGGCASTPPPTEQLAVSTAALSHAAGAGGTEAAPAQMRLAREKLAGANVAMTDKRYDQARSLAQEAQVDAQLAEATAHAQKATKAAAELQESNRVLSEEMDRAERKPK